MIKSALEYANPDDGSMVSLLSELSRLAISEEVVSIRQAILRQIGLLVNKSLPSKDADKVLLTIRNLASGLSETTTFSENAVRVLFWQAKGLILRLSHTEEVLERLLALLANPDYGAASARGFGLLLAPDEVLSKQNGANIRLLAKQRVFNICMPAIARDFRNADVRAKPNYLVALSGLLRHVPNDIIMAEVETLLPLLLQTMDLEDSDVKAATIQNLTVISQESPEAVEGHVGSLVTRLLKSAANPAVNTANVRQNALRCLRVFPGKIKDSVLLPYRNTLTRGLLGILDDPKRHVRKEAVECRAAWFNLDEPQSD